MSFDQTVVDMLDAIKATMGVPITYNGAPVTALNVLFGLSSGTGAGTVHAQTAEIEVDADDVQMPVYRDPVIIDGIAWRVHRDEAKGLAISGDGYTWKIPLIRDERAKKAIA